MERDTMTSRGRRVWRRRPRMPEWLRRRPPGVKGRPAPAPGRAALGSALARYGFAAALAVAAVAIEASAPEFFKPAIYFLLFPTAFLTAWLAGIGPAILHLLLGLLGVHWLFTAVKGGPLMDGETLLRMALFAAFNTFAAVLISRGRRAEAALRSSEERLRIFAALIENSTDFIGIADPGGKPVYVNPAGRRMVGLTPDQPVEETRIPEYYPPELRAFVADVIVKTMAERGRWSGETFLRHWRTQESIPVSDEHFMIREPETGRVLGMGTVTRDVTERKRLEDALRRWGEQDRFRDALEAAAAATVLVGRDGRIAFVNKAAEGLFGWTREELAGQLVEVLIPKRFRAGHAAHRERFFQEAEPGRPMGAGRDLVALRKDRTEVPIEAGLKRVPERVVEFPAEVGLTRVIEGGEEFVVVTLTDITLRKAAESALRESEARLRRSVVELEGFSYTVSHDLRAPLRAIQGYAHFLYRHLGERADAESRGMLERMGAAAARLDRLIRDILSYAAIGGEEVALETVELDEILAHVSAHYPELARVRLRVRAPLGRARGQPSLLIQVLSNLLVNAVKFSPKDLTPEIEVWTERREGGKVLLVVQDNGIGIPREALERIFQPFTRLHPPEEYAGTGIGLAIVKRAVERLGGQVHAESEPGRGSRFLVELQEA